MSTIFIKRGWADSLGVLPEDMMQELLTGVTIQIYLNFNSTSSYQPQSFTVATYSYKTIFSRPHLQPTISLDSF